MLSASYKPLEPRKGEPRPISDYQWPLGLIRADAEDLAPLPLALVAHMITTTTLNLPHITPNPYKGTL